jgi:hypothetical protein
VADVGQQLTVLVVGAGMVVRVADGAAAPPPRCGLSLAHTGCALGALRLLVGSVLHVRSPVPSDLLSSGNLLDH